MTPRDPITVRPESQTAKRRMMMIHGGFRHVPILRPRASSSAFVSIRDLLTLPDQSPKGA